MASGVDLGARRASIMSISWGGLWDIYRVVACFQSDKKWAQVTERATRNAVVPALSPEALPMGTQNR